MQLEQLVEALLTLMIDVDRLYWKAPSRVIHWYCYVIQMEPSLKLTQQAVYFFCRQNWEVQVPA